MQSNYTGGDSEFLMISSPRIMDYELLILDFAIDILEYYGKETLFKRTSLQEDEARFK